MWLQPAPHLHPCISAQGGSSAPEPHFCFPELKEGNQACSGLVCHSAPGLRGAPRTPVHEALHTGAEVAPAATWPPGQWPGTD